MGLLDGKVAFITGAASKRGMGHAIALKLAQEGANVIVTDKFAAPKSLFPGDENWQGLADEVKEINALGRKALSFAIDITKTSDVDMAVNKTLEQFGKIDILVHCAGVRGPVGTPMVDHTEKDWRDCLDVNVLGTFLVSKAIAKHMITRNQGGKIVIVASQAGTHGVKGSSAYVSSKFAAIGLVKTLALELGQYKINVNAINPGAIITNLRDNAFEKMAQKDGVSFDEAREKDYKMVSNMIPLGRMGTAEDIADLALYLASPQSDYITGEAIAITGGMY